ncbi:ribosome small subunit-dependent GTPase A [Vibrio sp. SCSIO 43136]|uniref:ribosome small subunit-dependent GTPase A n=1 Tax=Vibrio sp. SCSIO 43136 TaxID=2819101 RepID=UPI002075DB6F|nr:ribosome small subunit-dependent GTPase A [Vibrio sp. SCSIO 43136]USD67669.1 ribosome small subunit-dependent GTPase A [Vibrio sp. SCSIO 43136]
MNTIFTHPVSLNQLGWQGYYQQQLTLDDYEDRSIGRIIAHHKSGYQVVTETETLHLAHHQNQPMMTVGDWIVLSNENKQFVRMLERKSLFRRKAPGPKVKEQYIAANVDTVFIVCSLNHDFNLSRIERYLALASEAGVEPVIVLTKADLCDDAQSLRNQVQALDPLLLIEVVNGLDTQSVECLRSWCRSSQTVAFIGSSGVGKSTLINTLLGDSEQKTGGIREDDSKGRHTTTSRMLLPLSEGGLLMDTPGMRELQLSGAEDGVSEAFADIETLAERCRFSDCQHQGEPGCAVEKALESGEIAQRRLNNYFKLQREQARNQATLAEKRDANRQLGKFYRSVQSESRQRKKGY